MFHVKSFLVKVESTPVVTRVRPTQVAEQTLCQWEEGWTAVILPDGNVDPAQGSVVNPQSGVHQHLHIIRAQDLAILGPGHHRPSCQSINNTVHIRVQVSTLFQCGIT